MALRWTTRILYRVIILNILLFIYFFASVCLSRKETTPFASFPSYYYSWTTPSQSFFSPPLQREVERYPHYKYRELRKKKRSSTGNEGTVYPFLITYLTNSAVATDAWQLSITLSVRCKKKGGGEKKEINKIEIRKEKQKNYYADRCVDWWSD